MSSNTHLSVGFIGLGAMGIGMATVFLKTDPEQKFEVLVWNRTLSVAEELKRGFPHAKVAAGVEDIFAVCDVVIMILADGKVVQSYLDSKPVKEHLKQRGPKVTIYQMSTIGRQESIDFANLVHTLGSNFIECPVLGSNTVAAAGKLQILASGNKSVVEQHQEVLAKLGTVRFVSDQIGKSSSLKLALNQLVCQTVASFAVSLAMIEKEGLDKNTFMQIVKNGPFMNPYWDFKAPRMFEHNYSDANFSNRLLLKDVNLMIEETKRLGIENSIIEGAQKLVQRALDLGYGEDDLAALYEAALGCKKGQQ